MLGPNYSAENSDHKRPKTLGTWSRTGCLTCKRRHKKCDRAKPSCLNCNKRGVKCSGYQQMFIVHKWRNPGADKSNKKANDKGTKAKDDDRTTCMEESSTHTSNKTSHNTVIEGAALVTDGYQSSFKGPEPSEDLQNYGIATEVPVQPRQTHHNADIDSVWSKDNCIDNTSLEAIALEPNATALSYSSTPMSNPGSTSDPYNQEFMRIFLDPVGDTPSLFNASILQNNLQCVSKNEETPVAGPPDMFLTEGSFEAGRNTTQSPLIDHLEEANSQGFDLLQGASPFNHLSKQELSGCLRI